MSDITANVVIGMPSQLFTMPRSFKAVANGKIYISKIDTPPGEMTDPANSVQVYLENEDGSHVQVSQPLIINAGGFPVYNGQIAKFVTVEGHAMAVYDSYNAQQFYYPNVLKYDPDQLRSDLASSSGASLVGYGSITVKDSLDLIKQFQDEIKSPSGINIVGRFLNLDALRDSAPSKAGDVVSVSSAYSQNYSDKHFGGGLFESFDNSTSTVTDDGGINIVPSTGNFAWRRLFDGIPSATFFGVRPVVGFDNKDYLAKIYEYGKENRGYISLPKGNIESSGPLIVRKGCGFIGCGREGTVFSKTTNDTYNVAPGVDIDALVMFLGDIYDPDDLTGASDCSWAKLSGIKARRKDIVDRSTQPTYGIWAPKLNTSILEDIRIECGYYGFWGEDVWSNNFKSCQFLGLGIGQFVGFQISRFRGSLFALSGTSNVLDVVGVAGYQIGFNINSQQYTTLNSCTADGIRPMQGTSETDARAYAFINPHGIVMNGCGSEGVKGRRITAVQNEFSVYDGTLTVNAFQGQIAQENPALPSTPIFTIQNGDPNKFLYASFNNCNFRKDPSLTNQAAGLIQGGNTKLYNIASVIDVPIVSSGATYKEI
ncbi:phage head-binding domain-containing protein [Citrobacter freundii]|uniref:phage head-binding domain-containing protein n=1 Tax=Citrobacter freundii TaxID=546 RepID=UPI0034D6C386